MKYKIISILIFSFFNYSLTIDNQNECSIKPIKYLEIYINSRMWEVAGGNSNINLETAREMAEIEKDELEAADFFIPIIINQIKYIYSDHILEENEKNILIQFSKFLERKWNNKNFKIMKESSGTEICEKVNMIIDKYHLLSEDDSEFYKMIFTLDDGPYFGYDTEIELKKIEEIQIDNFKLVLRGNKLKYTLELLDIDGSLKWKKLIAKSKNHYITEMGFSNQPIRVKNELGYKVALYGEGELVQLYLKKNGEFRLFFHSW